MTLNHLCHTMVDLHALHVLGRIFIFRVSRCTLSLHINLSIFPNCETSKYKNINISTSLHQYMALNHLCHVMVNLHALHILGRISLYKVIRCTRSLHINLSIFPNCESSKAIILSASLNFTSQINIRKSEKLI